MVQSCASEEQGQILGKAGMGSLATTTPYSGHSLFPILREMGAAAGGGSYLKHQP